MCPPHEGICEFTVKEQIFKLAYVFFLGMANLPAQDCMNSILE